jgi:NAD+ synthase (glutamine-hydrolysing)
VVAEGYDADLVARIARLVDTAEYKRRQSPPGVRITTKAFGKDRRMPITNRYQDPAPRPVTATDSGGRSEPRHA